ncbi:hypothetical protein ElyMa_000302400 [Elysia marginata]|uniref:Uncharacterized protein n=1 Tax=Elysia marginata TaxID=1093978 RepID=A0AAV4F880_9GAST|nr:hypothetical protein ElyMa_000302400 [Elysia marginata]
MKGEQLCMKPSENTCERVSVGARLNYVDHVRLGLCSRAECERSCLPTSVKLSLSERARVSHASHSSRHITCRDNTKHAQTKQIETRKTLLGVVRKFTDGDTITINVLNCTCVCFCMIDARLDGCMSAWEIPQTLH